MRLLKVLGVFVFTVFNLSFIRAEGDVFFVAQRPRAEILFDLTDCLVSPSGDIRRLFIGEKFLKIATEKTSVIYLENITWEHKQRVTLIKTSNYKEAIALIGSSSFSGFKIIQRDYVKTILKGDAFDDSRALQLQLNPGDIIVRLENSYPGFGATLEDSKIAVKTKD